MPRSTAARVRRSVPERTRLPLYSLTRSEEHTSELQSHSDLVCRLLLEKKKNTQLGARVRAKLSPILVRRDPDIDGARLIYCVQYIAGLYNVALCTILVSIACVHRSDLL